MTKFSPEVVDRVGEAIEDALRLKPNGADVYIEGFSQAATNALVASGHSELIQALRRVWDAYGADMLTNRPDVGMAVESALAKADPVYPPHYRLVSAALANLCPNSDKPIISE